MAKTWSDEDVLLLKDAAIRMRINSIKATCSSNSGHPTSCSSIAEIMSVLFLKTMKYDPRNPDHPANDRFVLSKGHAAPILYAALAEVGIVDVSALLDLRKITSVLEGHPTPRIPFVDVATGSLGQGLSNAVGMAYVGKYWDKATYRVYVVLGDGESAEGSVWEAMQFASHYKLDNIVAFFDINRLGQSQATALEHDLETYRKRCEAFGWRTFVVDGHDVSCIMEALCLANNSAGSGSPVAIVAKTFKGFDFLEINDSPDWHGKPLGGKADAVLAHLNSKLSPANSTYEPSKRLMPLMPIKDCEEIDLIGQVRLPGPPEYKLGEKVATRQAYGVALARLGEANSRVVGLDGDTKNSTFSIKLMETRPEQFVECFIAEQNMVGVGIGFACRGRTIPFVSTFAAFLSRACDQLRMGAVSQTNCNFVGSHVGVSIGEDGPSQMALEDLAMFRSIQSSTVFYPSDAVSTEYAVELAANTKGICFIRTGRPATPVIYQPTERFAVGKGKIVRSSGPASDVAAIVAAGVTLSESMKAADLLAKEGVNVRIIDPFTVKPLDEELLNCAALETKGRFVVVEDHAPEGGLGEAVSACFCRHGTNVVLEHLAIREMPRSGKPEELLQRYGISSDHIVNAVKRLLVKVL